MFANNITQCCCRWRWCCCCYPYLLGCPSFFDNVHLIFAYHSVFITVLKGTEKATELKLVVTTCHQTSINCVSSFIYDVAVLIVFRSLLRVFLIYLYINQNPKRMSIYIRTFPTYHTESCLHHYYNFILSYNSYLNHQAINPHLELNDFRVYDTFVADFFSLKTIMAIKH